MRILTSCVVGVLWTIAAMILAWLLGVELSTRIFLLLIGVVMVNDVLMVIRKLFLESRGDTNEFT